MKYQTYFTESQAGWAFFTTTTYCISFREGKTTLLAHLENGDTEKSDVAKTAMHAKPIKPILSLVYSKYRYAYSIVGYPYLSRCHRFFVYQTS